MRQAYRRCGYYTVSVGNFVGLRANENLGRNERRIVRNPKLWERKSNSYYLNYHVSPSPGRLQVMMEPHTYDLKEGNERHVRIGARAPRLVSRTEIDAFLRSSAFRMYSPQDASSRPTELLDTVSACTAETLSLGKVQHLQLPQAYSRWIRIAEFAFEENATIVGDAVLRWPATSEFDLNVVRSWFRES